MRTIKSRGKSEQGGKWIYGQLISTGVGAVIVESTDDIDDLWSSHCKVGFKCTGIRVDPETVGQFTGLFDKDRRERFEGNIYKLRLEGIETHLEFQDAMVEWNHETCCFAFHIIELSSSYKWLAMNDKNIMVLGLRGNIHDTPELLTKTK